MATTAEHQDKLPTFRELYPHLTEAALVDAQDRFDRYIALAVRIFERLESDPTFPANLRALTAEHNDFTIESGERSIKN